MTNFEIPDSLKLYYSDPKIKSAVDALVDKLDGKSQPDLDWVQAQSFNKALLMAAQVRADFCDFLYRVLGATFGVVKNANSLGAISFASSHTVDYVWKYEEIELTFYRGGSVGEGPNDTFYVGIDKDELFLRIYRHNNEKDFAEFGHAKEVDGWKENADPNDKYMQTQKSVKIGDIVKDPDEYISEFQNVAGDMITALLK